MKIDFIIAANGSSTRFGSNKLLFKLKNKKSVIETIVKKIKKTKVFNKIIIASDNKNLLNKKILKNKKIILSDGGRTRGESVYNAFLKSDSDYIFIHDGARPFIKKRFIFRLLNNIKGYDIIVPVLKINDSLKKKIKNQIITMDRDNYFCTQTPQVIKTSIYNKIIKKEKHFNFEDEFEMYLNNTKKYNYKLVDGDISNFKLTYKIDI